MDRLKVGLEHCYGIRKLDHEFDFSKCRTQIIYAPNGVMKTSFAKTFRDIANRKEPRDQIDLSLKPIFDIKTNVAGDQISADEVCVIEPYNEKVFSSEDKILTLLANEEARKRYLEIYKEIDALKRSTLAKLKKISGSANYEAEIIAAFADLKKANILEIFAAISGNVKASRDKFDFSYNSVFDKAGKVKEFLINNIALLRQYVDKYAELISKSNFFSKNADGVVFGTTEARNLENSLKGDAYFVAGHRLALSSHGQISGQEAFSDLIKREVDRIFADNDLRKIFDEVDKKLDANKELAAFKKVIERDKSILLRLENYDEFCREVWYGFLKQIQDGIESLVDLYLQKKPELERIIQEAKEGQSAWEEAIGEFENRFSNMPFSLVINNKDDAILNEKSPAIDFHFKGKKIDRKSLVEDFLSQGEKRAFYLLNVIFEIKSRQKQGKKTLFIIDDIADSFDYKNKYAIVEYLNDLSEGDNFYSIILTHNFDFFRTLQYRVLDKHRWENSFIAEVSKDKIILVVAGSGNVTNPFGEWKKGINNNEKYLIAGVAFVRNLIEYKDGDSDDALLLTHVLHQKPINQKRNIKATADIVVADLEPIFKKVLTGINFEYKAKDTKKVIDVIYNCAVEIMSTDVSTVALEHKVILATAIRLKAENYIWSKVADQGAINGCQTGKLIQRFKDEFNGREEYKEVSKTLESVSIMTPENIHLNSFMYEPILDMGIDELKCLYRKVSELR